MWHEKEESMLFRGKKTGEDLSYEEEEFLTRFQDIEVPLLILDERWLKIFPDNYKTNEMLRLERELREAFLYQAKLNDDIKDAETVKKKLLDRIIQFMGVAQLSKEEARKQEKSQEFIRNLNGRIDELQEQFESMPEQIHELNQQLLIESLRVCYRRMKENKEKLDAQKELVEEARALLNSREARKQELHRENEHIFTFMHRIFGRRIIELFDEFDDLEDEDAEGKD